MQGSAHHTATIHAHKLLGDERVTAFLKAASVHCDSLAIDLANGFLRAGSTWEVRFVKNEVVDLVDVQSTPHEFAAIARASMRVA